MVKPLLMNSIKSLRFGLRTMKCASIWINPNTFVRQGSSGTPKVPNVTLNNGMKMPILGLGTWGATAVGEGDKKTANPQGESKPSGKGEVAKAIMTGIDVGYRLIDGAHLYMNEDEVGAAVNKKISEGVVCREELFITSKLWNTFHDPDLVRCACETSLKDLKLDYLDLYLIHWPMAYKEGAEMFPVDKDGNTIFSSVDFVDTWKAMEKLVEEKLCKSIGISNFNKCQIERILETACIPPVTNQVECHPYLAQNRLKEFCESKGITIIAYSPLGSPKRPWRKEGEPILLEDPVICEIAEELGKSPAQICLRYQVQRNNIVIPKTSELERQRQNIDVFNFKLCPTHMDKICALDRGLRFVPFEVAKKHKDYPFNDEF